MRPASQGDLRGASQFPSGSATCCLIYVTGDLASYERKRLIEQKVPFMVPGNQLYLPDLGIDLLEYFRQPPREPIDGFSPATQALLLRALLSQSTQMEWNPAAMAGGGRLYGNDRLQSCERTH